MPVSPFMQDRALFFVGTILVGTHFRFAPRRPYENIRRENTQRKNVWRERGGVLSSGDDGETKSVARSVTDIIV